jgi:hypothetical protein
MWVMASGAAIERFGHLQLIGAKNTPHLLGGMSH